MRHIICLTRFSCHFITNRRTVHWWNTAATTIAGDKTGTILCCCFNIDRTPRLILNKKSPFNIWGIIVSRIFQPLTEGESSAVHPPCNNIKLLTKSSNSVKSFIIPMLSGLDAINLKTMIYERSIPGTMRYLIGLIFTKNTSSSSMLISDPIPKA